MLLGASVHAQIVHAQIIRGEHNQPIAIDFSLGWLLFGMVEAKLTANSELSSFHISDDSHLGDILQNFWSLEEVPHPTILTADDQDCEAHFVSTHFRTPSGRYGVRLPLKNSEDASSLRLADSYYVALCILKSMECRFNSDANIYISFIFILLLLRSIL